jgi:hypothetical protein
VSWATLDGYFHLPGIQRLPLRGAFRPRASVGCGEVNPSAAGPGSLCGAGSRRAPSGVEDRSLTAFAEVLDKAREVDDDHVLAPAADEAVLAGSAEQNVVTGSAHQPIIPSPSV